MYKYGPASIWISGPVGGTWYATVKFRSQEKDFDARALDKVLATAMTWIDEAPELSRRGKKPWTDWKFDSERDARAFATQLQRDTKYLADRVGLSSEWVSTNAPDSVAVDVGRNKLGLVMQRRDRYASFATSLHQSKPPRGFRENPETGELYCPHRDVSCCPACEKAHSEIVEVHGQHFWTHTPAEKAELRRLLHKH